MWGCQATRDSDIIVDNLDGFKMEELVLIAHAALSRVMQLPNQRPTRAESVPTTT